MSTEISGIKNQKTLEKINETKNLFFEKMNKINNFSQANREIKRKDTNSQYRK